MSSALSPRLAAIVDALPITPQSRVLEIGCGTGAAARAIAHQLDGGHILAIDRSAKALGQARAGSASEIASGRLSVRQVAAESFVMGPHDLPFDVVFAVRVGALDGRHPDVGRAALARIRAVLAPEGRVFIDGGRPLREMDLTGLNWTMPAPVLTRPTSSAPCSRPLAAVPHFHTRAAGENQPHADRFDPVRTGTRGSTPVA